MWGSMFLVSLVNRIYCDHAHLVQCYLLPRITSWIANFFHYVFGLTILWWDMICDGLWSYHWACIKISLPTRWTIFVLQLFTRSVIVTEFNENNALSNTKLTYKKLETCSNSDTRHDNWPTFLIQHIQMSKCVWNNKILYANKRKKIFT